MSKQRLKYIAQNNDVQYWECVDRNLGWLGNSESEQRERQNKLKNVVIGIAGTGGIGGAIADRLVRMEVKNLKIADPDTFELSNINRQLGACVDNIGRNKAEVVAEMVYGLTKDVNIEVYNDGITSENADEFVAGCDYVMDKIELYNLSARYALNRAFRRSSQCQFMLLTPVFGHRAFVFKWTKTGMPAEEVFGLPENVEWTPQNIRQLMERFITELPSYPSLKMLEHWFIEKKRCPIFAGCPPIAQGLLVERLAFAITGLDQLPGAAQIPEQAGYAMFDVLSWQAKIHKGKWWS